MTGNPIRTLLLTAVGLLAVPVVAGWNWVVGARAPVVPTGRSPSAESDPPAADGSAEAPAVIEHERSWPDYLRGFDAHHGPAGSIDAGPAEGSLLRGLRLWVGSRFLRGYTLGNDVYVTPRAPTVVRVHQAGHTPEFGAAFDPLAGDRRENGGLPDEPLRTADVMLPGGGPHVLLRLRDPRGLAGAYRAWLHDGHLERVAE
ncbi:hypothetical protein I7X12_04700 [Halosimplex litoreum]|uniref:Uncharacterized protein n=1 Tax=Halosimplex litoreum TaxID=1198301 RepID=A0A7T3G053_9EURY|nr:hypothetical protein [Halosimplex litoreum]QPV63936.1 hypothetical protein I7X12_04700 [Halosimplex litoreum]